MEEAKGHGSTKEGTSSIQMASNWTQSHIPAHTYSREKEIEADLPEFSQVVRDRHKPWSHTSSFHEAGRPEVPCEISNRDDSLTEGTLSSWVIHSQPRISRLWALYEVILKAHVFSMGLVNYVRRTDTLKPGAEIPKGELELALD